MAKAVRAIDLEIAAELNPEAPETTSVDVEALRRKIEEEYIRAEMIRIDLEARLRILEEDNIRAETIRVDLEAQRRKIEEDNIRGKMIRADLKSEQIAELKPEAPVDLEARRRKIEEDCRWAQMRADAEARQRQLEEDYNRVKHLVWVVEKPLILFYNCLVWLLENKLEIFEEKPRRRKVWAALGGCSCAFTILYGKDLCIDDPATGKSDNVPMNLLYSLSISVCYPLVLIYLYNIRHPLHCVLRLSHKQLIESALVLLSSSWIYYTTDDYDHELLITGPFLCLDFIPCLNLLCNFDNFGFLDCCLFILIEAALLCCHDRGLVVLMAVTVVGLALQFMKNAYSHYRSHKIKNQTLDHVV